MWTPVKDTNKKQIYFIYQMLY